MRTRTCSPTTPRIGRRRRARNSRVLILARVHRIHRHFPRRQWATLNVSPSTNGERCRTLRRPAGFEPAFPIGRLDQRTTRYFARELTLQARVRGVVTLIPRETAVAPPHMYTYAPQHYKCRQAGESEPVDTGYRHLRLLARTPIALSHAGDSPDDVRGGFALVEPPILVGHGDFHTREGVPNADVLRAHVVGIQVHRGPPHGVEP